MLEAKTTDSSLEAYIPDSETYGRQARVQLESKNAEAASFRVV
jgi:hypothetical protein